MDLAHQFSALRDRESRLLFAVPKKGRLHESTLSLLEGSDIQFRREHRLDIALVKNHKIALVFLPADAIPMFVAEGEVDLGITGLDQVKEEEAKERRYREVHKNVEEEARVGGKSEVEGAREGDGGGGWGLEEVLNLGFGKCKLQVQVPENGPMKTAEELVGKRVVTSFTYLAEEYFRGIEKGEKGAELRTHVKHLSGSVEAACSLGVADGIVDLVESGDTMRAAGLTAIDTVVESYAVLIKSKRVSDPALAEKITNRIRGVITAKRYILCQYNIPRSLLPKASQITPGKRAPTVTALEDAEWVAVSSMVEKSKSAGVMDELTEIGATDILCLNISNSRTS